MNCDIIIHCMMSPKSLKVYCLGRLFYLVIPVFSARQHTCYIARYMLSPVRPSVRLSVCLSVTLVDQSKTVEVRIMQLSPQGSPMTLVF